MTVPSQEESLFLDVAFTKQMLSEEQVHACQAAQQENPEKSVCALAVAQGFLTPTQVAAIYRDIQTHFVKCPQCGRTPPTDDLAEEENGQIRCPVCDHCFTRPAVRQVAVVAVPSSPPEDSQAEKLEELEGVFLRLALQEGLITAEDVVYCQREHARLVSLGLTPQMPALLYMTGLLPFADVQRLYAQAVAESGLTMELATVQARVPATDLAYPRVCKAPRLRARRKPRRTTTVRLARTKEIPTRPQATSSSSTDLEVETRGEVAIPQAADEVLGLLGRLQEKVNQAIPIHGSITTAAQSCSSRADLTSQDSTSRVPAVPTSDVAAFTPGDRPSMPPTAICPADEVLSTNELSSAALQSADAASPPAAEIPTAVATAATSQPPEEEQNVSEESQAAVSTSGKQATDSVDLALLAQQGGTFENQRIKCLDLSGLSITAPLRIVNCTIEEIIATRTIFQAAVDFSGTRFNEKSTFKESVFEREALFKKTNFKGGADFSQTIFKKATHFNNATFGKFVTYHSAQFHEKVIFTKTQFKKGAKFAGVSFEKGASFNDIYCGHRFTLDNCVFGESVTFSNSQFADVADFAKSSFQKEAKFLGAKFSRRATFNSTKFGGDGIFKGAYLEGDLSFESAHLGALIDLKGLRCDRNVNFQWAQLAAEEQSWASLVFVDSYIGRIFIEREQLEGHLESLIKKNYATARKEFSLLKNHFRETSEYDKEDWAYLMEKRMERKSIRIRGPLSLLGRFFNWLALDLCCGYGTKPLRIFLSSLIVLICFALVYYLAPASQYAPTNPALPHIPFMEAVLLSFQSFTNAQVQSWQTVQGGWINYVMMLESFLGLFVIAVLVVTFSRKVIR